MLSSKLTLPAVVMCLGNAPVAPLIEGSFDGVLEAAKAARVCGYKQMRIQIHAEITSIYDEGGPTYGGTESNRRCLAKWTQVNAKRLSIAWVLPDTNGS